MLVHTSLAGVPVIDDDDQFAALKLRGTGAVSFKAIQVNALEENFDITFVGSTDLHRVSIYPDWYRSGRPEAGR
jgi:hypothetical protein